MIVDLLSTRPQKKAELAEKAGWYTSSGKPDTRSVELAIHAARLEGSPIVSDGDGYRITHDAGEVRRCADSLRRRLVQQAITARALKRTARRLEAQRELTLPW